MSLHRTSERMFLWTSTAASYEITYDVEAKEARFEATIQFAQESEGSPIFDMVETPTVAKLDGKLVRVSEAQDPDNETRFKVAQGNRPSWRAYPADYRSH